MADVSRKVAGLVSKTPFLSRSASTAAMEEILVAKDEMIDFTYRCMRVVGASEDHAKAVSEVLVGADYRGHYSHGVNRLDEEIEKFYEHVQKAIDKSKSAYKLIIGDFNTKIGSQLLNDMSVEMYVNDIHKGVTATDKEPEILKESACTAWVNGMNALGPVVGNFCMQLAIRKAKQDGIGWVVAKGSNHYGIAGWYSLQAADQGLLGMSFTNTSPLACTTRGKTAILGTNPLSLAAPVKGGPPFCLDMATTTAAIGKVEICDRKGIKMPRNWGADSEGLETEIPAETLNGGSLLPLGGSEVTGGYKGYGLSMMVEIFCGILAGATYGPNIRKWKTCEKDADLGQCFFAINPDWFAPGFEDRMADITSLLRSQPPAAGETEVLVAGDPEMRQMQKCESEGGIRYHPNVIGHLRELAESLGTNPVKTLE